MGSPHLTKLCKGCGQIKPVEDFNFIRKNAHNKRRSLCKICSSAVRRQRETRQPKYDPENRRDYKLRQLYGISLQQYNEMADLQNDRCAICGSEETRSVYGERPKLVVDHNHTTNKVRGLLCASCNGRLAAVEDEQFRLLAMRYLQEKDGFEFVDYNEGMAAE